MSSMIVFTFISLCGNPSLLGQLPCEKKKKKKKNQFVIPVVVSLIVVLLVSSIAAAILWNRGDIRAAFKFRKLGKEGPCDVFLSFRGKDTRNGFRRYLYEALRTKGVKTYVDDEELKKGDEIRPALLAAIEASKISVIVLSKNYTSSSWCLDELVKILDCRKTKKQVVYPIFYYVVPADVRYQSDSFNLDGQVKHNEQKIPTWEKALTDVANLAGLTYPDGRKEIEVVNAIVEDIYQILSTRKSKKLETLSQSV